MTINLTVSPSFPNERITDWYIFNTWLQRALNLPIHLELYDSFGAQRAAIAAGNISAGSAMLASGQSMPSQSSTINAL